MNNINHEQAVRGISGVQAFQAAVDDIRSKPMSDHFSGPRAIAGPAGDITDLYAFPSPERPGHLVLVLDVMPDARLDSHFSEAIVYRLRLRPVTIGGTGEPHRSPSLARTKSWFSAVTLRLRARRSRDGPDAGRLVRDAVRRDDTLRR